MSEKLIEPGPNAPAKPEINPFLKFALELGPLVVFFFANSRGDWLAERFPALAQLGGPLFIATALFMAATVTALAISWSLTRTLPIMPLVSGFFVLALGGLTLWFQSEYFIKIKPTIVNLLFSVILFGGILIFNRPLIAYVFSQAFKLDDAGWRKLTLRWGFFFIVMAIMNEVVWRGADYYYLHYLPVTDPVVSQKASDSLWAGFKVWATMPITMVFMLFQIPLLKRHATEPLIKDHTSGRA